MPKLEIAATSVEDVLNARKGGANSVEISHDLSIGGLTPSFDLVRRACDACEIDIHVMIRPHARSFVYDERDIEQILEDARKLSQIGIQGIVFGALTPENRIDIELITRVVQAAAPLPVTLHRALDHSLEPEKALAGLVGVVPRVLTGGPANTAWEARAKLAEWVSAFGNQFRFVISGGLKLEQMPEMLEEVRAHEYHFGSAARTGNKIVVSKVRALGTAVSAPKTRSL
jgi:copper homeostasis protein